MDPKRKNAIERLFNVLGKKIAKDRYNLDLNFEVVGELKESPYYSPVLMILIETNKKLPPVFRNKQVDEWSTFRYDNLGTFQYQLGKLLKYLGLGDAGLIINPSQNQRPYEEETLDKDAYIKFPERFLPLIDETFVLEKSTGYVHYLLDDNSMNIDEDNYYHLSDIDDEWFWNNLTPQDKRNIEELYG